MTYHATLTCLVLITRPVPPIYYCTAFFQETPLLIYFTNLYTHSTGRIIMNPMYPGTSIYETQLWGFFHGSQNFCFVAKVVIIRKVAIMDRSLALFGYKPDMKYKTLIIPYISLAKHSKPNIQIWRFYYFFSHFWQLKASKITSFSIFLFWISPIKKKDWWVQFCFCKSNWNFNCFFSILSSRWTRDHPTEEWTISLGKTPDGKVHIFWISA